MATCTCDALGSDPIAQWQANGAGTEKMTLTAAGRLGIGTTTPDSGVKLHVVGAFLLDSGPLYIGSGAVRVQRDTDDMTLYTASTERLRITADGKVGINAGSPTNLLTVGGDMDISGKLGVGEANPTSKLYVKGSGNSSATSALNVTNSVTTSLLYVRDDARVGISTSSPACLLDVRGQVSGDGNASGPAFAFVNDLDTGIYSPSANALSLATGGTERLKIDSSGNITIAAGGKLLTLSVKSDSGTNPTGVIGAIYYNSVAGKVRVCTALGPDIWEDLN